MRTDRERYLMAVAYAYGRLDEKVRPAETVFSDLFATEVIARGIDMPSDLAWLYHELEEDLEEKK